jgi:xanthine dehydrogenase YagT iron-sulfur-binding subunit
VELVVANSVDDANVDGTPIVRNASEQRIASKLELSMRSDITRRDFLELAAAGGAVPSVTLAANAGSATASMDFRRRIQVGIAVNGRRMTAEVEARATLLDWLREHAGLTGTKKGCNEGACGTCTVLIDGQRMNSCLTLVAQCDGREITTVEGIAAADGSLHAAQAAFIEHDAFQCGYCTPGQIVSAVACISEGHATDEATVREWMSGNLCRCAAYPQITAAVLDAARQARR